MKKYFVYILVLIALFLIVDLVVFNGTYKRQLTYSISGFFNFNSSNTNTGNTTGRDRNNHTDIEDKSNNKKVDKKGNSTNKTNKKVEEEERPKKEYNNPFIFKDKKPENIFKKENIEKNNETENKKGLSKEEVKKQLNTKYVGLIQNDNKKIVLLEINQNTQKSVKKKEVFIINDITVKLDNVQKNFIVLKCKDYNYSFKLKTNKDNNITIKEEN